MATLLVIQSVAGNGAGQQPERKVVVLSRFIDMRDGSPTKGELTLVHGPDPCPAGYHWQLGYWVGQCTEDKR